MAEVNAARDEQSFDLMKLEEVARVEGVAARATVSMPCWTSMAVPSGI